MRDGVSKAIEELKAQFAPAAVIVTEDGSGGAHVIVEGVDMGVRFVPSITWIGGHITAQHPYADIYPLFVGSEIRRADGKAFEAPVTPASFAGRSAWQISRRSPNAQVDQQKANAKFLKVINFLQNLK
ncbi:MAG TPA: hypothetical protein VN663_12155 [Ramlibacter sp.]|nr:hypothetical protein [Ramlibacter sp.]